MEYQPTESDFHEMTIAEFARLCREDKEIKREIQRVIEEAERINHAS